ncbi:synergin gamma-like [Limulus polyphemus]|uniref:Synergin gamma-like n=1 Tax=Limulus polyphemus TaxID=6850 RepID=A0ABM1SHJ1_LIMPO|nr:synergin gamma-like [Limulus polyphemus]
MDQRPPISDSALGNVAESFLMWQVPFSNIQGQGMMPQAQLGKSYAPPPTYFQYQQRYPPNALGNISQGVSHPIPNPAYVIRCNERMVSHYQQVPSVTTGVFRPRHTGYQPPDPAKLSEQKSKLEKERNFQMQQQKLKQFSQCGLKPSLNPDSYINIMLGKDQNQHKPSSLNPSTSKATGQPVAQSRPAMKVTLETSQEVTSVTWAQQQVTSSEVNQKATVKNDPAKGLEDMMMACSDLSKPQQPKPFQKLAVNDIRQSSHQKTSCFTDSQKARNWKNIQDLDEFGQRFPPWCSKNKVPSLYHQVQKIVTGDGNHPIDTQCLYPILLSSGLQRGLLGLIWELISQTTPGQLVEEELYMGLALVALAQAGYKFNSIEILYQLHQPPVPLLQLFTTSVPQATISTLPGGVSNQATKFPTSSGSTCTSVLYPCPPGEPVVSSVSYPTSVSSTQANSSILLPPQSQHLSTSYQEQTESSFASTQHFPVHSHISLPSYSSSGYQDVSLSSSKSQTFAVSSQASVVGSRDSSEMHFGAIEAKPVVDQQALSVLHLARPVAGHQMSSLPYLSGIQAESIVSHQMTSSVPHFARDFPKSHVDPNPILNSKSTPVDSFQWASTHPSSHNTWDPHTITSLHPAGDNLEDDEFDEFQSASVVTTISEVQSHDTLATSISTFGSVLLRGDDDDEFDDFKQAVFPTSVAIATNSGDKTAETFDSSSRDLMAAEEDKYSVFRMLQEQESSSLQQNSCSLLDAGGNDSGEKQQVSHSKITSSQDVAVTSDAIENEEDFGDFLYASAPSVTAVQDDFQGFESFQTETAYQSFGAFESFKTTDSSFANFDQFNINSCGLGQNGPTLTLNLASPPAFQLSDEKDEFGDFTSSQATLPRTETGSELSYHGSSKDNISLAESQSISSLELPTYDSGGHNGESKASLSRHGSIPSLDLKSINLEETDSAEMMQESQGNIPSLESAFDKKEGSPEANVKKTYNDSAPRLFVTVGPYITSSAALTDRYSSIRTNSESQFEDVHVSEWNRCLTSCQKLLYGGWQVFHQMPNSLVCSEVLSTEEGSEYIKNLTEVQRVVQRIKLAIQMSGKETDELQKILLDTDSTWQNILVFIAGTSLMPEEGSLDFSSTILPLDPEDVSKACGVCLLNVEGRSKAFDREQDSYKLMYGGRQYHAACANLWVNCVDSLLPALPLPHLL